jgi:hypothetical protein
MYGIATVSFAQCHLPSSIALMYLTLAYCLVVPSFDRAVALADHLSTSE